MMVAASHLAEDAAFSQGLACSRKGMMQRGQWALNLMLNTLWYYTATVLCCTVLHWTVV